MSAVPTPKRVLLHSGLLGTALTYSVFAEQPAVLAAVGIAAFALRIWLDRTDWGAGGRFGAANWVTALRVVLIAGLGLLPPALIVPWAGALALAIFALDGVDGWLARRNDSTSKFGAAFDEEADAFLIAMATLTIASAGLVGWWVVGVGALRYGFVLATASPRARGVPPRSALARYGFVAIASTVVAVLLWPSFATTTALGIGSALVTASFARALAWSWLGPAARRDGYLR